MSHVDIHGFHQLRPVPPHLLPGPIAQMPMESGKVGSRGQHRCAVVLHLRILLVILAERGRPHCRELQLGECHVHCYCCDQCGRLPDQGSPRVQRTSRILRGMEREIGQVAIRVIYRFHKSLKLAFNGHLEKLLSSHLQNNPKLTGTEHNNCHATKR
jgi:hypothetical protein